MDPLTGAVQGYFDFIHSLVRWIPSALFGLFAVRTQHVTDISTATGLFLLHPAGGICWEGCWRGFSHEFHSPKPSRVRYRSCSAALLQSAFISLSQRQSWQLNLSGPGSPGHTPSSRLPSPHLPLPVTLAEFSSQ